MLLFKKLKNIFTCVGNLLFENHSCIVCDKEILDETKYSICDDCFKTINRVIHNEVDFKILESNSLSRNISYCYYDHTASIIVKRLKYSGKKYYSKYIAQMMTELIDKFGEIDYLTFVPSSPSGLKRRGYNQSYEIAKEISKLTNIKVLDILGKREGFLNQAGLSQDARRSNLENAFFIKEENKNLINNKRILLIDDVFTTGTTIKRCLKVLQTLNPKVVNSMTFAKTKFDD